jgi:hypothetical protein
MLLLGKYNFEQISQRFVLLLCLMNKRLQVQYTLVSFFNSVLWKDISSITENQNGFELIP